MNKFLSKNFLREIETPMEFEPPISDRFPSPLLRDSKKMFSVNPTQAVVANISRAPALVSKVFC